MTIAFWCVFLGGLIPVLVVLIAKRDPALDVANPRDVHRTQTGLRKRAYGAHLNGHEAFPLFAAGVFVATFKGSPQAWIDGLAAGWVVVRLAYTGAYLGDLWKIRPALWFLSVLAAAALFWVPGR